MGAAALGGRLLLAAVFIAAGAGKLLDLPGSRRALVGFGVSNSLARVAGTLLPLVELAAAAALLVRPSAQWGAVAALVLLIAFIVGIANALARGEQPDCHCFGAIHSAPVGRGQVARNVGLGAVALFVVATGPGPSIDGWIASRNGAELAAGALTVAALGLAWFGLQSWVENRRLREALEEARDIARAVPPGLPAGASAPEFAIRDGGDRQLTLEGLRSRGRPIALVFMRPGCGPCATQVPEFVRWQESLGERLSIGLVGLGALERFEEAASRLHANLSEVLARDGDLARETDELAEVLTAYRIRATPSAVIVNPEGTIASATVDGRPAIEGLIRLALSRRTQT